MGKKNKLKRFADMKEFKNVFEPEILESRDNDYFMKGKWRSDYFKNDNPLVLELGCGKGEYTVGLAKKYPNKNFIGIDIKGARMWVGAKESLETPLPNVAFLRTRIDFINRFFAENEVDEIWITFPDPQPQKNRMRKRLTHPMFLDRYKTFLKPNGLVHLKTDSAMLHEYTLEVIKEEKLTLLEANNHLYANNSKYSDDLQEILGIRTHYETIFTEKGFDITYLKFKLN